MEVQDATHIYKGSPVRLIELTYEFKGEQFCTVELVNKVGKIQRQTLQLRRLAPISQTPSNKGDVMNGTAHRHANSIDRYECRHPQCRAQQLINSSVDDLRASLACGYKDKDVLERALKIVRRRKETTKAKMLQSHLKKLPPVIEEVM